MTNDRSNLTPQKILDKYIYTRIAFEPNTGCWIWMGNLHRVGCGTTRLPRRDRIGFATQYVTRFVYESLVGPIQGGFQMKNLCNLKACANPTHHKPISVRDRNHEVNSWKRILDRNKCSAGHEYAEDNTSYTRRGHRRCRACIKIYRQNSTAKKQSKDWGNFEDAIETIKLSENLSRAPAKYYVYHLVDPFTGMPFYIGKGCGARVFQHEKDIFSGVIVANSKKDAVIRSILAQGGQVEIKIVQRNLTEAHALWLERLEIDLVGLNKLTNRACGTIPNKYRKLF